jgi:hypothetical protein
MNNYVVVIFFPFSLLSRAISANLGQEVNKKFGGITNFLTCRAVPYVGQSGFAVAVAEAVRLPWETNRSSPACLAYYPANQQSSAEHPAAAGLACCARQLAWRNSQRWSALGGTDFAASCRKLLPQQSRRDRREWHMHEI